jgi:diguanylate cyclase (GGDEF)-like protein
VINDHAIRLAFLEQLPEDRRQLETAWESLRASATWGAQDRAALILAAHRLTGVALTVGYSQIGQAARQIEHFLKSPNNSDQEVCERLVATLLTTLETPLPDGVTDQDQQVAVSLKNVCSLHDARSSSQIYLTDDDPILIDTLSSQMRYFGYSVETFTRPEDLRAALERALPAAILMDIMFPEGELAGIETIRTLQAEYHNQLPVFFLSARDDVTTRLHAIRIGGKHYFSKPVDIAALVDALDKVIVATEPEQFRVLIVDDAEVQAKISAMHLSRVGIETRILTNPLGVVQALEEFLPDLLLLDLYMPECTGLELAQVIRQIKAFVSIPIVYLSAETDREKQLIAVGLGGDDFLTKPIKPGHLISAVTSRIERYRQLRALMLRDSLTGLYNHTSIRERLAQELARAARNGQPLALAMIDIDHFKQVNDSYGHATGDRVLKALTHMFTRRLRQSDVVGRYGGEEFVLILPDTAEAVALQVVDELREAFSQVQHVSEGQKFRITFSVGVATFPRHQTPAALSEAADQALYTAKREGRNRVELGE